MQNDKDVRAEDLNAAQGSRPRIDFAKREIPDTVDFFKYPTKIGHTLAGYSDWVKGTKPIGHKEHLVNLVTSLVVGLGLGALWYFLSAPDDWRIGAVQFAIPTGVALITAFQLNKRRTTNLFIGTEGFAVFECGTKVTDIAVDKELRWDEITDLYTKNKDDYSRSGYRGTYHEYHWYNRKTGKSMCVLRQYQRDGQNGLATPPKLMFAQVCEVQWTDYLLGQLEHNIQANGHETFYLQGKEGSIWPPFIYLNHQGITFIRDGKEYKYLFQDIQRIYWEEETLRIQHKNFEKVLLFFRKGNEEAIFMPQLSNRRYFEQALEKMLR